jgi:hypothetical protein
MAKHTEQILGEADAAEDSAGAELVQRLTRLHRWMTRGTVALALLSAGFGTWWIVKDDVGHGGFFFAKFVGVTGGISFAALFLTVLGLGVTLSSRLIRGVAASRRRAVVAERGFRPDALGWVVTMFKPGGERLDKDDDR